MDFVDIIIGVWFGGWIIGILYLLTFFTIKNKLIRAIVIAVLIYFLYLFVGLP